MNTENNPYSYLIERNRDGYENSRVLDARSYEAENYYAAHKISELGSLKGEFGIPIFRDGDRVLTVPYSHSLFVGATGSGKTIYIINQVILFLMLPPEKRPNLVLTDCKGELSDFLTALLTLGNYNCVLLDCKNGYQGNTYNILRDARENMRKAKMCEELVKSIENVTSRKKVEQIIENVIAKYDIEDSTFCYRLYAGSRYLKNFANKLRFAAVSSHEKCEKRINGLVEKIVPVDDPKDRQWVVGGRMIIKGLIMSLLEYNSMSRDFVEDAEITIGSVADLCFRRDENGDFCRLADFLKASKNCDSTDAAGYFTMNAKVTRDGYISLAQSALSNWRGNGICALTGESSHIDLGKLADSACRRKSSPFAVFLKPDEDDPPTSVLLNIFVSDFVAELKKKADSTEERRLPRQTLFILDEFANLGGKIDGMENFITTMRSRNVFFEIYIQSYEQLKAIYGEPASLVIRQNCDLTAFLGTNSYETRHEVAQSYGMSPTVVTSETVSSSGTGINRSTQNRANVRVSDLEDMDLGEIYVQYRRLPHLHSYVKPYFELSPNPVAPYYRKAVPLQEPELDPDRLRSFSLTLFIKKAEKEIRHGIDDYNCEEMLSKYVKGHDAAKQKAASGSASSDDDPDDDSSCDIPPLSRFKYGNITVKPKSSA